MQFPLRPIDQMEVLTASLNTDTQHEVQQCRYGRSAKLTLSGLDSSPLLLHANITYVVCGGSVKEKTVTNKIYVPYVPFSGGHVQT